MRFRVLHSYIHFIVNFHKSSCFYSSCEALVSTVKNLNTCPYHFQTSSIPPLHYLPTPPSHSRRCLLSSTNFRSIASSKLFSISLLGVRYALGSLTTSPTLLFIFLAAAVRSAGVRGVQRRDRDGLDLRGRVDVGVEDGGLGAMRRGVKIEAC